MFPRRKRRAPLPVVRRTAGQSLREEWDRLINDNLPFIIVVPLMLWFVWFTHWQQPPLSPRFWFWFAVAATGIGVVAYLRLMPKARRLVRGERGELKVAEALDGLRSAGYRIFHDLCREGYNIDHVVVGPAGVFAIETKFCSGSGEIEWRNGDGVFVNGKPWQGDRDPVVQARGNAAELRKLVKETCELNVFVTALVVFVGDCKVKANARMPEARVLAESQLPAYFERRDQPELTRAEITLIASHLERSVRC